MTSAWFRDLFGFDELDSRRTAAPVYANFTYTEPWLYCAANNTRHHAGKLTMLSVASQWEQSKALGTPLAGNLRVPAKSKALALDIVYSDVTSLHADPANAGAVFMVASQFNCLEFAHHSQRPEQGITIYANDCTQGPACSVCCAAGTVIRNYFCFRSEERRVGKECRSGWGTAYDN